MKDMTPAETTIWRYMDLPKFVSIIVTRGLYFVKAATLSDDPYEGFSNVISLPSTAESDEPKCVMAEGSDGTRTPISFREMKARMSQRSAEYCEKAGEHLYVNSWCLGLDESMAMWQIYGSLGFGIAVKSTIDQFQRAARFDVPPSHYRFGSIKYHANIESSSEIQRDFRNGAIPLPGESLWSEVLDLSFHKRSCYAYENEWRAALYQDRRPEIAGIHESFDLDELITEVYVGPRAEEFIFEAVTSIMDKFSLRKPVKRSQLLVPPNSPKQKPDTPS